MTYVRDDVRSEMMIEILGRVDYKILELSVNKIVRIKILKLDDTDAENP